MMFRITSLASKARCLLHVRKPPEVPNATISCHSPAFQYKKWQDPERETCPKKVKKPPSAKDDAMFWGAVTVLCMTGGFAVYAQRNPQVRDWLSLHAPWFDDIIAVAYQENMTYLEFLMSCTEDAKKRIVKLIKEPKDCSNENIITVPEKPEGYIEPDEEESPCDLLPAPVLTNDICEIEACMKDLGDDVVNNYLTARDACRYYNKLVDDTLKKFTFVGMKKLRQEMDDRRELVKKSVDNADASFKQLNDLVRYMDCGGVCDQKQRVESAKEMMNDYKYRIKMMQIEYQWENDKAIALDEQWTQLEVLIDKYTNENKAMYPGLNYEIDKPGIEGDSDFLLLHTRKYIQQLDGEVKDAMATMTGRVNRSMETLPQCEKSKKATGDKINALYKKRKAELDTEFSNRLNQLKADNAKNTKDALNEQLKRHEQAVVNRLREREVEVMKTFNNIVADKVAIHKKVYDIQLRDMSMKLKLVEDRLNARLKADLETKRSQELWSAGSSLLAATKKGEPFIKVNKELRTIERACGDGDKLVATVLHGIPQSVWDKGVVPESVLREKYHSMENVALKVALVEREGSPFPVYVLSWIQSILLFQKLSTIPQIELDNPPKEPYNFKDLDTFDLLQRARYYVERGNIAAALRYVNALTGASRTAADTWYEDARAHVETRQAAEAIIAHAAAIGLQYI